MKGSTKVRLAMTGMALGAVAVAALPASADTGTGSIAGTGTISPGLTQAGDPGQSFTFGGSGAGATTTQHDTISCTVTGNDTIGSWAQGSGSFNGECTGSSGGASTVSGNYTRTGAVVTLAGTAVASNSQGFTGHFNGDCEFTPTNIDPTTALITSFAVVCGFTVS